MKRRTSKPSEARGVGSSSPFTSTDQPVGSQWVEDAKQKRNRNVARRMNKGCGRRRHVQPSLRMLTWEDMA